MDWRIGKSRLLLAAAAMGNLFALLDDAITGRLAAIAWPHWYIQFARVHRHLSLESIALPFLSPGVWLLCGLGIDICYSPAECPFSLRALSGALALYPTSGLAGIVLPACGLVFAFRRTSEIVLQRAAPKAAS